MRHSPRSLALAVVALATLVVGLPAGAGTSGDGPFLAPLPSFRAPDGPTPGPSVAVSVDLSALPITGSRSVPVRLLGVEVDIEFQPATSYSESAVWYGSSTPGGPFDSIVVSRSGAVSGTIATPAGRLVLGSSGGAHYAHLADPESAMVPPPVGEVHGDTPDFTPTEVSPREPAIIDVLIVYTQAAQDSAGGKAAIEARAATVVERANMAFENSEMGTRWRLAGAEKVDYAGQGFQTDLFYLQRKGDGVLDEVHVMRDDLAADLVHLLVTVGWSGGYGNIGPHPDHVFSVARVDMLTWTPTAEHELGHALGLRHDIIQAPDLDTYARGHVERDVFFTIMGYQSSCGGSHCEFAWYWSTPGVKWPGTNYRMGVPIGDPGEADAATHVDEVAHYVASFRVAVEEPSPSECEGLAVTIIGTDGDDVLVGTEGDDIIQGLEGNDVIDGLGGDDIICGDWGEDEISGGDGRDKLYGGDQDDFIIGGRGRDFIDGGKGDDLLRGQGDRDKVLGGDGNDKAVGGSGNDTVKGQGGDDTVKGQPGNDRVLGNGGNDRVLGGSDDDNLLAHAGDDVLKGQSGNDTLRGGRGNDILRGGGGDDLLLGQDGVDVADGQAGDDDCTAETVIRC